MSLKIIVFCIFISLNSIAQNVYVFKSDVLQVSFPVKPFFDTVTVAGGFKVRSVASRDSISNYYLSIIEKVNPDSNNVQNTQNLKGYFDGVMDGFGERYRSETIYQKMIRVSADSVGEFYSKGYYGQTPINIRSWICLKGVRTIVCQHLYTVKDKDALKRKQETFFQSLILFWPCYYDWDILELFGKSRKSDEMLKNDAMKAEIRMSEDQKAKVGEVIDNLTKIVPG